MKKPKRKQKDVSAGTWAIAIVAMLLTGAVIGAFITLVLSSLTSLD